MTKTALRDLDVFPTMALKSNLTYWTTRREKSVNCAFLAHRFGTDRNVIGQFSRDGINLRFIYHQAKYRNRTHGAELEGSRKVRASQISFNALAQRSATG